MMKIRARSVSMTVLSTLVLMLATKPSASAAMQECSGCVAEGGGTAYLSCPGGDYVYIEVLPSSGTCITSHQEPIVCGEIPCNDYVYTEWQLPVGTTVNRCLYRFGTWYCQHPPIAADGTVESDWRYQSQACNDEWYTHRISANGSCGLTLEASLDTLCSECEE